MYLVNQNVHVVTGSDPTIHSNYKTSRIPIYCCPNDHRSASMFHSWNQALGIIGFFGRSPKINRLDVNNVKGDSSYHITYFQSSDIQVL
jgi:hypothetical protein